jgi:hypothetical protein
MSSSEDGEDMLRIIRSIVRTIMGNGFIRFLAKCVLVFLPFLISINVITFASVCMFPYDAVRTIVVNEQTILD